MSIPREAYLQEAMPRFAKAAIAVRHGHSPWKQRPSRTYRIWAGLMTRMRNRTHHSSKGYLHLDYDKRWGDFCVFLQDMGECPEGLTIDRIDNAKGYWPDNCRWATPHQQSRNTSRNVWVLLNGERMIMQDALTSLGYTKEAYYYLRKTYKFSAQQAINRFSLRPKQLHANVHGPSVNG